MPWFEHRHSWRPKLPLVTWECFDPGAPADARPNMTVFVEHCPCGAAKQIEIRAGVAPVIRITEPPTKEQPSPDRIERAMKAMRATGNDCQQWHDDPLREVAIAALTA